MEVFLNRYDGSLDFGRNITEYEDGFGTPWQEVWLGMCPFSGFVTAMKHMLDLFSKDTVTNDPNAGLRYAQALTSLEQTELLVELWPYPPQPCPHAIKYASFDLVGPWFNKSVGDTILLTPGLPLCSTPL